MELWAGDNREVLPTLESGVAGCVLQDPPFGLTGSRRSLLGATRAVKATDGWKFAGRSWDINPVAHEAAWWSLLRPVLTDDAVVLSFGSTRTWHRQAAAMLDAGYTLHGVWAWVVAGGLPASIDVGRQLERIGTRFGRKKMSEYGTGLMRAWTPILVASPNAAPAASLPDDAVIYHPRIQTDEQVEIAGMKHPTQKPVGLLDQILDLAQIKSGSTMLDPFAGTAATAVSAAGRDCRWIGIELCDGSAGRPDHIALADAHCRSRGVQLTVHR